MKISDFDYRLPSQLIAQHPVEKRDGARLMVVDRASGSLQHSWVRDLPRFISGEDLLVLNNSRVIPARLYGHRESRDERIEVLLLRCLQGDMWEALVKPGKKATPGTRLVFLSGKFEADVVRSTPSAVRILDFKYSGDFHDWIEKLGSVPLPPYLNRRPTGEDRNRYQTVYADVSGSVAAPTAGLHFTPQLLRQVPHCEITLHVGYGTFKPISSGDVGHHEMDEEYYEVGAAGAQRIAEKADSKGRVIAVGTTTTRALEHIALQHGKIVPGSGWTGLFVYPGFDFKLVEGLLTNFHLPRSTLLLLVCALAGRKLIDRCYREAIQQRYRFYSYGDAMLIL